MQKTVTINSTWMGGMRVDVQARDHKMVVDQPDGMGGRDEGPTPLEYQLVALGGCLGTVAAIIAKQERIDLRGFSAAVEGDFDTDFLMGKTTEGQPGFTEIRVAVEIDADMTAEEKQAFFHRVDARCPISDNLMNGSKVVFEVR